MEGNGAIAFLKKEKKMTVSLLSGKRVLITQPMIRGFAGSTVVTLELAVALTNLGAKVTVYTCDYNNPMRSIFEAKKIKVTKSTDCPVYKLADFDYVWIHSQILPISLVEDLANTHKQKKPSFIFLHMSGMDWIPDEKPWIFDLENKLSSLSLFISEEVKDANNKLIDKGVKSFYFRNPTPMEFRLRKNPPSPTLKKLLIVSNHPPEEVIKAKKILERDYNIDVTVLGECGEKQSLLTLELLSNYDAVLTIAKTVQYCLVSGTPVYVYDAYGGGPGWLNTTNFDSAKKRNFSGYKNEQYPNYEGDGFFRKTAANIAKEIVNGYSGALSFHRDYQKNFCNDFLIEPVLKEIFSMVEPRSIPLLDTSYIYSVIASQRFAELRFAASGSLYERDEIINNLREQNASLEQRVKDFINYKRDIEKIFDSRSYKLYKKIISPYIYLKEKRK